MIIQLIQTIQITLSIANGMFLDRNYNKPKPPQYNAQVNYNEQLEITYAAETSGGTNFYPKITERTYNNLTINEADANLPGIVSYQKRDVYKSFNAMTVIGNVYIQRELVQDENNLVDQRQYVYLSNENVGTNTNEFKSFYVNYDPNVTPNLPVIDTMYNQHYTTTLICLSITPYNNNINTESTIRYYVNIAYGTYFESLYPVNMYLRTDAYTSIEEDWHSMIGLQNYAQNLPNLRNQYIGANAGYTYQTTTQRQAVSVGQNTNITSNIALQLTPNKTNYVLMELRLEGEWLNDYNGNGWTREYIYLRRNNTDTVAIGVPNSIAISGTMLIAEGDTEVVDIPGMMFDILGMPFTFISIAFNLTLFPGTPYQLNISNLFLSLLAIAVFMWIMSKILRR